MSRRVRAKFSVESLQNYGESILVNLSAVYDGSEENKEFWKYTPAGHAQLTITNPDAFKFFEQGKEYYLDFTLAQE